MAPEPRTKGHLSETIGFIWKWALCFTNFFQNSKQPDHRAIRQTDDLRSVIRCLVQHDATLIAVKLSSAFFFGPSRTWWGCHGSLAAGKAYSMRSSSRGQKSIRKSAAKPCFDGIPDTAYELMNRNYFGSFQIQSHTWQNFFLPVGVKNVIVDQEKNPGVCRRASLAPVPPDLTVNSRVLVKAVEGEEPLPGRWELWWELPGESAANSRCQVPSCSSALHNLLREHGWASNWMSLRARIAEKCSRRKPVDTCHGKFDDFFSIGMPSTKLQVQDVTYFTARPNHGLFVRAGKVQKIQEDLSNCLQGVHVWRKR